MPGIQGTWAFISAKILCTSGPVEHTPWDDMESAFWVLVYLALMFLQHNYKPRALHQTRQRLFDNTVRETDGSVTGGHEKRLVVMACIHGYTRFTLPLFGVPGLNKALEDFGRVFEFRYLEEPVLDEPESEEPVLDEPESEEPDSEEPDLEQANLQKPKLAEPDLECIPALLRRVALTMKPLSITPTGLVSPTNDSKPHADPTKRQPVDIKTVKKDFNPMPWSSGPEEYA
jgi:hypothetical protein